MMTTRTRLTLIPLILLLLAGCAEPLPAASPGEMETSPADYIIAIAGVTVVSGAGLSVRGTTTLPEDHCVYTQLFADGVEVDWWLVGKCYPLEGPDWTFTIPLGVEGTPPELDPGKTYRLEIWWPGAPAETRGAFEFDLAAPPAP